MFCQMRQMQHQTENCLVPEESALCHVSWAFFFFFFFFFIHAADCLCLSEIHDDFFILDRGDSFENSPHLIVTNVTKSKSFCVNLRFLRIWTRLILLLSPPRWHWTLFPLPADGCCSFHYQGEAERDFFQLLLIHHRLDCRPRAWDYLVSLCNITWSF